MTTAEHTQLVKDCLSKLAIMGYAAWENKTGATEIEERFVKFGKKGSADIIAPLPLVINGMTYGIHVEIEVKTGKASLQKNQKTHRCVIGKYGCPHYVVRSVDSMVEQLAADGFAGRPANLPPSAFAGGR